MTIQNGKNIRQNFFTLVLSLLAFLGAVTHLHAQAPVITSAATIQGTVGQSFSYTITATGSPTSFGAANLPAGLSLDATTGVILGTPTTAGTYLIKLSASNAKGTSAAPTGTVVAWGRNSEGQTTVPAGLTGVTAIAGGDLHTVALKSDGTVVAWGRNDYGQTTVPAGLTGVTAIAAGAFHTVALKSDGTVVAWGNAGYGQTTVPAGLTGVTAIDGGAYHTVALKSDGTVVAWGRNAEGQTTVPAGLTGVTAIAAGRAHTVALKSDGTVVAWGSPSWYVTPTVPAGLTGVTAIAGGEWHTVAFKSNGTLMAWGSNGYAETTVPAGLTGVTAIAGGWQYTVALKSDGTVVAWGLNDYGQTTVPAGLTGVTAIAAGVHHTVALVGGESKYVGTATATIVISKAQQMIEFAEIADAIYPATPIALSAIASSGLGVTFSVVSGPATVSGSTLTLTGLGIVTVRASQAGDKNYLAASVNPTRTFTVKPPIPVITSADTVTATVYKPFVHGITATYQPTSYGATNLPAGVSLDPTTGVISGSPTTAGSYTIKLSASNAFYTGNQTLTLHVQTPLHVLQAYVKGSNTGVNDTLGFSVGVSGDTAVVGAYGESSSSTGVNSIPDEDASYSGAAYVFVRSGTNWIEQAYLKASNSEGGDRFGFSVAVSGNMVVIGAPWEGSSTKGINSTPNESSAESGAAYVFVRSGTTWTQQAYLKASNTGSSAYFGRSVAVSGETVVVGAYGEASSSTGVNSIPNDAAPNSGAAYVFARSGGTWTQQAFLKASNTGANDSFGRAVAVSGDTVVVGAYGEASSSTGVNSATNEGALDSGAAYVFARSGGTWTQQAFLKASNTGANDSFGRAVAVSGDTVVVGAYGEDSSSTGVNSATNEGALDSGAAYVFARSGGTWTQQAFLKAGNTGAGDQFSASVAVSGESVVIGANGEDSSTSGVNSVPNEGASDSGAAYVFVRSGTIWTQQDYLKAGNTREKDVFGISVAVSGGRVIVGAPKQSASGAAYFYGPQRQIPTITSADTASTQAGQPFSHTITATEETASFGTTVLPTGLSLNPLTGVISGTPTIPGTTTITLSAFNAGGEGSKTLTLTVKPYTPVITSADTATGKAGEPFSHTIKATDEPTSFGAVNLPSGLSLNSNTGVISGVPTTKGTFTITLSASNEGGKGSRTFTLTLRPYTPVITSADTATGKAGQPFSHTIKATQEPTSFGTTVLPTGLSLNPLTGVISGTPTIPGTTTITLSAFNAGGEGSKTLTLTVNPQPIPVITSADTGTGKAGQPFSHTITATQGPTSFGAADLPEGLSINPLTGVISGIPTKPGTTTITVSAFNVGGEGSKTFTLAVKPRTPVITSAGSVTAGARQPFAYAITGAHVPTSFGATGLPAGLSLDPITGEISGSLTTAGTYTITLSASNDGGTGTQILTVSVAPLTLTIKYLKRVGFDFIFNGDINQGAVLEYSTDFIQWTPLATKGVGVKELLYFEALTPNTPYRFYRVIKR